MPPSQIPRAEEAAACRSRSTADGGGIAGASPQLKPLPPDAEELHFQTESAAELYFKQGLYREALAIYKNLFEKTGRTDFFLKIKAILLLLRTDRKQPRHRAAAEVPAAAPAKGKPNCLKRFSTTSTPAIRKPT